MNWSDSAYVLTPIAWKTYLQHINILVQFDCLHNWSLNFNNNYIDYYKNIIIEETLNNIWRNKRKSKQVHTPCVPKLLDIATQNEWQGTHQIHELVW